MNHTRTETREERFLRLLREAVDYGAELAEHAPSRELSLAITNAQQAELWAKADLEKKEASS